MPTIAPWLLFQLNLPDLPILKPATPILLQLGIPVPLHSNQLPPIPVPRTNSRPVRRIEFPIPDPLPTDPDSVPVPEQEPMHLNCIEDEFVTEGTINGIPTSIVVDSGARISLISTDFVDPSMSPVSYKTISDISQIPKQKFGQLFL